MDLNQLLYYHQIAIMRAAGQCNRQPSSACLIDHYRRRVHESFVASDATARNMPEWKGSAA